MKKVLVVIMAAMAMTVLLVVPAFGAPKLIVKAANGNDDVFHVEDTGNVGVFSGIANPTAPVAPLDIRSASSGNLFKIATTSSTGGAGFEFTVPGGGDWLFRATQDNGFKIRDNANLKDAVYIQFNTGNVGIGTLAPTHKLEVCGTSGCAYNEGGTTWVNASSREYKENIKPLSAESAMDTLKGLNPVTFMYKAVPGQNHVGFIAEDVPDLVAMRDRKGLSAMDIVAVLTKTVQEQQKIIEKLNEKLIMLEHITDTLTGRNMVSSVNEQ
jgi:hypothetical protein